MEAHRYNEVKPLSNTRFESDAIQGTPLWDMVFNPDYDITTIRANGFVIKVKNYFIRENANCTVLLHSGKLLIKVTITNGRIDEYESLPGRMGEQFGARRTNSPARKCENADYAPVAWIFKHNRNEPLNHKREEA